jgi:hypothetical protein
MWNYINTYMNEKFNRLAVLLCGQYREWPRASKYIFEYFDALSDNIDYYFITWSTDSKKNAQCPTYIQYLFNREISKDDIIPFFDNKNLINCEIINPVSAEISGLNTFYKQSYLGLVANQYKRTHEKKNGFIYDQVFELRPDLYISHLYADYDNQDAYIAASDKTRIPCLDDEFRAGEFWYEEGSGRPALGDYIIQSSSAGNDISARRFFHNMPPCENRNYHWDYENAHYMLADFFISVGLNCQRQPSLGYARPIRSEYICVNFHRPSNSDWEEIEKTSRTQMTKLLSFSYAKLQDLRRKYFSLTNPELIWDDYLYNHLVEHYAISESIQYLFDDINDCDYLNIAVDY